VFHHITHLDGIDPEHSHVEEAIGQEPCDVVEQEVKIQAHNAARKQIKEYRNTANTSVFIFVTNMDPYQIQVSQGCE
jgi:hypothetical protein